MLKDSIRKHIEAIDKMGTLAGPPPVIMKMQFGVVYLGELSLFGFFQLEIKDGAKLGWLYSDASMVLFKTEGNIFTCELKELKAVAEERLKAKKFLAQGQAPAVNMLRKNDSGLIEAWIDFNEVMKISTVV